MESKSDTDVYKMDAVIEVKQEPRFLDSSTKIKCESEGIIIPDVLMKSKLASSAYGFARVSDIVDVNSEANAKIKIKEEPLSVEQKSGLEESCNSNAQVMNDLITCTSDFIVKSDSDILGNDNQMDIKIDILKESIYLETALTDLEQNKDTTSEGEQEFTLPESTRLGTPAVQNYESDVTSTNSASSHTSNLQPKLQVEADDAASRDPSLDESTSVPTFSHPRRRKIPKESVTSVLIEYLEKTDPLASTYPHTDAITTMFLSMAETVRSFPPDLQIVAKKRVVDVIIQCEAEAVNRQKCSLSGPSNEVPVIQSTYIAPN